jgi:hypothetical protein
MTIRSWIVVVAIGLAANPGAGAVPGASRPGEGANV